MTLNDLEWSFCVKIWSELGTQWAGVLAFGENCSEICRTTRLLSATKNVAKLGTVLVIFKSYGVIQWNNRTGSVKPVNYIYSFYRATYDHDFLIMVAPSF